MRYALAFFLLASVAQAETFTAWVSESWKAQTTNWTVQVMDGAGALVGKDIAGVESDLGAGSGASVSGTIVTTTAPNQWVTVQFYDSDVTDYAAAVVPFYLGANGVKAEPTDPIYADTQQIRNVDLPAVKADTGPILADTNEMQQDQQANGRLDTVWQNTATTADNIYTDTQALLPLLTGVNVTQIAGADAMSQLGVGVWDALTVNHNLANTFGALIQTGGAGLTAQQVWEYLLDGPLIANSAGRVLYDWQDNQRLDVILDRVDTNTQNISVAGARLLSTTVVSGSGTSYVLTDGSPTDNAYNGMTVVFRGQGNLNVASVASTAWIAASKTLNVASTPNYVVQAGDAVEIYSVNEAIYEARDLLPPQESRELSRRADGTVWAPQALQIAPGESIVLGLDAFTGPALPQGAVVLTMSDPTGLSGELTATKRGTNGRMCNMLISATEQAAVGTIQYVETRVTPSTDPGSTVRLICEVRVARPFP